MSKRWKVSNELSMPQVKARRAIDWGRTPILGRRERLLFQMRIRLPHLRPRIPSFDRVAPASGWNDTLGLLRAQVLGAY